MNKVEHAKAITVGNLKFTETTVKTLETITGLSMTEFHEHLGELKSVSRKHAVKLTSNVFINEFELLSRRVKYFTIYYEREILLMKDGDTIAGCAY